MTPGIQSRGAMRHRSAARRVVVDAWRGSSDDRSLVDFARHALRHIDADLT